MRAGQASNMKTDLRSLALLDSYRFVAGARAHVVAVGLPAHTVNAVNVAPKGLAAAPTVQIEEASRVVLLVA